MNGSINIIHVYLYSAFYNTHYKAASQKMKVSSIYNIIKQNDVFNRSLKAFI